jgi:hypothetical protein
MDTKKKIIMCLFMPMKSILIWNKFDIEINNEKY